MLLSLADDGLTGHRFPFKTLMCKHLDGMLRTKLRKDGLRHSGVPGVVHDKYNRGASISAANVKDEVIRLTLCLRIFASHN